MILATLIILLVFGLVFGILFFVGAAVTVGLLAKLFTPILAIILGFYIISKNKTHG